MSEELKPSRRDVLTGSAALTFSNLAGGDAMAGVVDKQPLLTLRLRALQFDLEKGGRYYRMLHAAKLDMNLMKEMVAEMQDVSDELRMLHFGGAELNAETKHLLLPQNVPGLFAMNIETFESVPGPNGTRTPLTVFCNFFTLHAFGVTYLTTANHCVEGTAAERSFFRKPRIADFAVRRVPDYKGPALALDSKLTNETLSGLLGITVGSKAGIKDAFYGPLVKMTDTVYKEISDGEQYDPELANQLRNGFWKVLPPGQGDTEEIVGNTRSVKASGRSGSLEIAYDPRKRGYVAAGNFIAVKKFSSGPFAGHTIGFYSGPEALLSVIEQERGDVENATRSSEWVGRVRR